MVNSKNSAKKGFTRSLEELEMILDNIPGLVFYKDDKNNLIRVNKYFADAHKTTKDNLAGKNCFDIYPKDVAQKYFDDDLEVIKSKKSKLNFIEPWDVAEGRRWINSNKIPLYDDDGKCIGIIGFSTDVTEQVNAEQSLRGIEWLLETKKGQEQTYKPSYGNLTELNTDGILINMVGEDTLIDIVRGYLDLLETSAAIYEKNGNYAVGIFSSGWCQFVDRISRNLCETNDNIEALKCGKWLCHESCWTEASKVSIETGQPVDVECHGGLHLYAVPIIVGGEPIGSINIGYGDPPKDPQKLQDIAEKYKVSVNELRELAEKYESRPPFIIDIAKKRLITSAKLISNIVERRKAEDANVKLAAIVENSDDAIIGKTLDGTILSWNKGAERIYSYTSKEIIGKSISILVPSDRPDEVPGILERIKAGDRIDYFETVRVRKDGEEINISLTISPIKDIAGNIIGASTIARNITERKQLENENARKTAITEAINEIFQMALTAETEEEIARKCLEETQKLTNSKFGYIGEINQEGKFDTIAHSNPGWDICKIPKSEAVVLIQGMEIKGYWGKAITERHSVIVNDPALYPEAQGTPEGHPTITSFLGVPMKQAGQVIGLIGIANKEGGYDLHDQEAVETLSVAFIEALMRKRAEIELEKHRDHLDNLIQERVKELNCLYELSKIIEEKDITKEEILKKAVKLIPPAWQFSDITCARIQVEGKEYKTENFKKTEWKQSSDIFVANKKTGLVEVCYLEKMPEFDEGPFLKEERYLIDALAERLGKDFERINAELKVTESEKWLSATLESIGDAVIATDAKGNISFLNPVAESLTGWKQSDVMKKPVQEIFNIINEDSREEVENPVDRVVREGAIVGLANHTVLISKDGREIPIDDSGAPIKDKEGKIIGVVLIFRDITKRRRAEEALREREKYDFLLETLTDGVLIIDREWRYLLVNNEVARMVQMPKEKLIGNKMTDLSPGIEDTVFGKTYKQVLETGEPAIAVDEFIFPEGRKIWYRVQVYPASEGLLIIVSDITERKEAEEKEHHKTKVVNAINEIFQNTLTCESVEELGKTCLEVAQELSGAKFGFFGEVNKEGKFDTIAISNPGWDACKMPDSEATMIIKGMEVRGMQFLPLKDGKSRIFNDPSNHPDSVGTPKGHPKITCLLTVPFKYKGKIIGQIGLGNKPGGFNHHDQEAIEALSIAMIESLMYRRVEDKLRESEERFRMVFESKLIGTIFWNAEGEITDANEAFLDMIGYTKDEVLTGIVRWKDMTPPEYLERDEKLLKELATNGYISPIEKEYYHKDGHRIPIILGAATLQGSTVSGVAFVLDITERKLAEKTLSIKNGISDVFLTVPDEDMYNEVLKLILEVMESKYGTFGYIDENGALVIPSMTRHIWEACQVSDKAVVFPRDTWGDSIWPRAIKMKKTLFSNESSSLTPKGHVIITRNVSTPIIHKGKVIGLIQIANKETNYTELDIRLMDMISKQLAPILNARLQRDVEEKKRKIAERKLKIYSENLEETVKQRTKEIQDIQDELISKERLAVLGQLAGGVGHELRNPLGAIKNATYFLNMVIEEPEPEVKETLEILEQEVNSSEKIINSLLGFARPKSLIIRKVEINNVIREVLSRSTIPGNVELIDKLGKSLPFVLADPDQLKQVFGNIILNATQAMSKGGQLTVKSELQNQDYLAISIIDSGEGISEENLEKIFKPLFTTKAKGIGLGLAICKTIVEKHGGSIEAKSELGKGSIFMIKLPIKRMETI